MDQVKELLEKVAGNMETFKGRKNVYTVIGKSDNGAKLGVVLSPARELVPTEGAKAHFVTGVKVRFAMVGGEGTSINVAPFTVRGPQNFNLSNDKKVPGFLLDASLIGLTKFEMSPFEFLSVCKEYQIKDKLEKMASNAMAQSEFKPTGVSLSALFDLMVQAFPTEEDRQPPEVPEFGGEENVVTFALEKKKKKSKKYDEDDEDNDSDE